MLEIIQHFLILMVRFLFNNLTVVSFGCPSNGKGYLDMFSYQIKSEKKSITILGIISNLTVYVLYADDAVLKSSHTLNSMILCRTDSFPKQTP